MSNDKVINLYIYKSKYGNKYWGEYEYIDENGEKITGSMDVSRERFNSLKIGDKVKIRVSGEYGALGEK